VGGRSQQASLPEDIKNPVILPRRGHVNELVVKDFHEKTQLQGRGFTLNGIRLSGYWITGFSGAVSTFIKNSLPANDCKGKYRSKKWLTFPRKTRTIPFI